MSREPVGNCTTLINQSKTFVFDAGWQAIPETIVLNLILFFFFLLIFIILRRIAWGRKDIKVGRINKGWLQSIYGDRKLSNKALIQRENAPVIHHEHDLQTNVLMPPNRSSYEDFDSNFEVDENVETDNDQHSVRSTHSNHRHQDNDSVINVKVSIPEVGIDNDTCSINTCNISVNSQSRPSTSSATGRIPDLCYNFYKSIYDYICSSYMANVISNTFKSIKQTFHEVGRKLSDVLLISNKDILNNRGNDALQYIIFQQYIIYFLLILTLFCIIIILPINLQGTEFDTNQGFARTTIINLPESSHYYWIHVVGTSIISLIGVFMMHRFSKEIRLDEEKISRRTLLIRHVPKCKRNKETLANYFKKIIPNCVIEGIQSVYDVRRLTPLRNELTNLVNARYFCNEYLEVKKKRLIIRPSCLGCFRCGCVENCKPVDGLQFYTRAEDELQQKITAEMKLSVANPTGGFFITFQTEKMSQEAFVALKAQQELACPFCPFSGTLNSLIAAIDHYLHSTQPDGLEVSKWIVSYAPYPDDINWCDITVDLRMQWIRSIILNLLLIILFVFISTPMVIINASDTIKIAKLFGWVQTFLPDKIGSKVPELFSPLILVMAASVLPSIVTLTCQYIAYVNMSAKHHAIMWKVYLYLVLMVIIWPSLGLTSLKAFLLHMLFKGAFPWNCLFPVNSGAFFVNYTLQNAFIGNIMELMRIPELLIYCYYIMLNRSKAEVDTASRYVVWDFGIGIRYAKFLLIFAMTVTYSVACPIITVAGLTYMIIKHLIDRYNIYHVYNPSKISSKIHSTAIMFVHIALLMMQAQIFTVTLVRTGYSRIFALSLIIFMISLLVFSGNFFFYMFTNINHLTFRAARKTSQTSREYCACSYLPPLLYNLTKYTLTKTASYPNAPSMLATSSSAAFDLGVESLGSSQNLIVPAIETSDAFFLIGEDEPVGPSLRPKFGRHTGGSRKTYKKSRRTASDGQQQFHPNRLVQYEELHLKRTNSDLNNVM